MLEPPIVSLPYVELTERMLRAFGVAIDRPGPLHWQVEPGDYAGRELRVEGDHSSASYFLAAAAVRGGRVRIDGLDPQSVQPDARLGALLEQMGCRRTTGDDWIEIEGTGSVSAFDVDLSDAPDLGPTVAVLGLFADGPSVLRGVAHLRHKESDRLALLAENLTALGRPAHAEGDRLVIGERPARFQEATIRTAGDHRMAMAFALAGLAVDGVNVDDADCVAKSNPAFWEAFERLEQPG